jgi:hypothetical protein
MGRLLGLAGGCKDKESTLDDWRAMSLLAQLPILTMVEKKKQWQKKGFSLEETT